MVETVPGTTPEATAAPEAAREKTMQVRDALVGILENNQDPKVVAPAIEMASQALEPDKADHTKVGEQLVQLLKGNANPYAIKRALMLSRYATQNPDIKVGAAMKPEATPSGLNQISDILNTLHTPEAKPTTPPTTEGAMPATERPGPSPIDQALAELHAQQATQVAASTEVKPIQPTQEPATVTPTPTTPVESAPPQPPANPVEQPAVVPPPTTPAVPQAA